MSCYWQEEVASNKDTAETVEQDELRSEADVDMDDGDDEANKLLMKVWSWTNHYTPDKVLYWWYVLFNGMESNHTKSYNTQTSSNTTQHCQLC